MPWHPTVLSLHPQQPQGPPVPKGGTQNVPQSALQVPGLTDSAKMRNVRAGLEHTSQTPVPITDPPARGMMLMAGNVLGECGFASSALPLGDAEDWLPLLVPSGMSPSPGVLPTPRGGFSASLCCWCVMSYTSARCSVGRRTYLKLKASD